MKGKGWVINHNLHKGAKIGLIKSNKEKTFKALNAPRRLPFFFFPLFLFAFFPFFVFFNEHHFVFSPHKQTVKDTSPRRGLNILIRQLT
jgi:hypothetical protein